MNKPSDSKSPKSQTNGRVKGRKRTVSQIPIVPESTESKTLNEAHPLEASVSNGSINGQRNKKSASTAHPHAAKSGSSFSLRRQLLMTILPMVLAPLAIAGAVSWGITNYQATQRSESKLLNDALLASNLTGSLVGNGARVPSALAESPVIINAAKIGLSRSEKIQILAPGSQEVVTTITANGSQPQQELLGGEPILQKATALLDELKVQKGMYGDQPSPGQKPGYVANRNPLQGLTIVPYVQEGQLVLTTSFNQDGRKYTLAVVPGIDWVSISSLDLAEIGALGNEHGLIFILTFLALGAVGAGIAVGLARRWSAPLNELTGTSEQLASGNLDTYVEPRGSTETQTLAVSFNHLVGRVKDLLHQQELEAKRAKLFAEIAAIAREAQSGQQVFSTAIQGAQEILKAERVFLYRFNPDWSGNVVAEAAMPGLPSCLNRSVHDTYFIDSEVGVELYRKGRVFVVDDIYNANLTPCHARMYEEFGIKANIITPIVSGDKLLGLMCTQQCSSPRNWQPSEVDFCTQLSVQMGLALDRISYLEKKETEVKQQAVEAKRIQLCADIATVARESLDVEEVFQKAVQGAQQILNTERVFLYRFNPDWSGDVVAEAMAPGWPSCMKMKVTDTYFTDSDVGVERYRNGRIFVIHDIYQANLTGCHIELYERLKIKANIITPLVSGDKLLGLLCTQQCSTPRTWQQYEVDFCAQLSLQVGLALDRINFFKQKEAETRQQEVEAKRIQLCADIATIARESLDVEEVIQRAVQGAQQILNAERVFLYRFNPDWSGNVVAEALALGFPSCLNLKVTDTYFTDSDAGVERYRNGRVFVIDDIYKANLTGCHIELYERLRIKANIITPLVSGDKLLGLLCTQQCSTPRTWQQYEVDFCAQLSLQVGLALDRITFLQQKEAETRQQEVEAKRIQLCADIATIARESLDVEEVFQKAVQGAQHVLNAERVFLYRFNPDWSGDVVAEALASGFPTCLNFKVTDTYFTDSDAGVERYRKGRVFVIDDIYKANLTGCHIELYERLRIKANVITPIVSGDKLLGLLCTQQCSTSRTWQQYEVDFCSQLSTQVGLALDRITFLQQKEAEAKQQDIEAKRIQVCADIATSARESLDVEEVFQKAVIGAQQILNAERVFLYRFNADWSGNVDAEAVATGFPSCMNLKVTDTYFTDSDAGVELYRKGRIFVIDDIYKANLTGCHVELYERLKIKANVITPVVSGDKLLGLMCTQQCSSPRAWQQYEVDFCTQLSTQVGLALDRITFLQQKEAEAKQQDIEAKRTHLFADIANSASESFNVHEVFEKAVQGAQQILNAERVFVYRFNPDWSGTVVAEAVLTGLPSCMNLKVTDTYFTDSDVGVERYRKGRVFVINDIYQADLTPCHIELYERLKIKANVITPIVSGDKLLGLMCIQECSKARVWQQSEIALCTQLSTQVGLAIDRISYLEQKEAEAKRSQLLSSITLRIRESLKLEDILNTAVEEIRHAFETDRLVIYRFDGNWDGRVIAESVGTGWVKTLGTELVDTCLKETQGGSYNKGRVRAIDDIYQGGLNDCHIKMLERFQVKANLVVPVVVDNELFGLLIAHQCSAARAWQKGEIDLLTQLGTQVGLALNQAKLVEQIQTLLAAQEQATLQQSENAQQQRFEKEALQKRALELLMEVDPVSKGDLTIRAKVTEDEIGTIADSYNATIGSLRKIVSQVQTAAKQVTATTSSNELAVQELSAEALRQTEEIVTALDRIQEMSHSIRAVATNAEQAEAAVQQATQIVKEGDAAMNRTVDGILAIRETVAETSKKVKRLGESSQKISKVVNLIGTFAAQTNLLALNASIEAARAGEEGRGFAVVADEVRSLARQSAAATAEIEKLVAGIQAETNEVVAAMEAGTEQVVTGTKLVDETRQSLNKITTASAQISALVEAIAQAASVQSKASDAVTQTMSDVAAIANKTSAGATNVQSSFKELLALAQELQANVGQFKLS